MIPIFCAACGGVVPCEVAVWVPEDSEPPAEHVAVEQMLDGLIDHVKFKCVKGHEWVLSKDDTA
jgi:hypothetical protein